VCPENTVCEIKHHLCVSPDAVEQCATKAENDECAADPITGALRYCTDGLCVTAICGDGAVTGLEECDDENGITGDGCSAACKSEGCGNGIVDPVRVDDQGNVFGNEECDDHNFLDHDGCSSTCKLETPRWTQHFVTVDGRGWPAMAYDAQRDRIVAFGGYMYPGPTNGRFGDDTLEWNGRDWSVLDIPGPQGRFAASMVYDSTRHEIVLFGGEVAFTNYLNDMWRFDGVAWKQVILPPGAAVPAPRSRATMVYDTQRKVIVLYGGKLDIPPLPAPQVVTLSSETWEFDGAVWTLVSDNSPPGAREHAGATYDPVQGGMVIVGGDTYAGMLSDTWLYKNKNWQQLATSLPTQPTGGMGVTFDIAGQRLLAVGGNANPGNTLVVAPQTSTLTWNGSAWISAGVALPAARSDVAVVSSRRHVIAFGGRTNGTSGPTDTVILTPTSGWAPPAYVGTRFAMASANLRDRASAIIYGGQTASGFSSFTSETFELTKDGFFSRGTSGPTPRSFAALAYDAAHRNLVLFGGSASGGANGETWLWTNSWASVTPSMPPPARSETQFAFDGVGVAMVGGNNGGPLDDAWRWNGSAWAPLSFTLPTPKFAGAASFDPIGKRMIGNGGRALGDATNTSFSVTSGVYAPEPASPIGNYGSSMVWNPARQKMTVLGGISESSLNAYELDTVEKRWISVPVTAAPQGRTYAAAVASIDGTGLLVMSGSVFGVSPPLSDSWELSWQGPGVNEQCDAGDADRDELVGCADPDCWWVCTPACPPGTDPACDPTGPRCGDNICDAGRESCRTCPGDCMACNVCGDGLCDAGETCPGDCP
jgi:cysteine-rich repeat protein